MIAEKFEEMLLNMYGEEYEDAIETFIESLGNDAKYIELDELFIRWGEFLAQGIEIEKGRI